MEAKHVLHPEGFRGFFLGHPLFDLRLRQIPGHADDHHALAAKIQHRGAKPPGALAAPIPRELPSRLASGRPSKKRTSVPSGDAEPPLPWSRLSSDSISRVLPVDRMYLRQYDIATSIGQKI